MIEYWIEVGERNAPIALATLRTPSTSENEKYAASWPGKARMLMAKMIGMTPARLTRSGRNVCPPWYMRRPRTRLAYWIGIRRWPSWIAMITATDTIAMI